MATLLPAAATAPRARGGANGKGTLEEPSAVTVEALARQVRALRSAVVGLAAVAAAALALAVFALSAAGQGAAVVKDELGVARAEALGTAAQVQVLAATHNDSRVELRAGIAALDAATRALRNDVNVLSTNAAVLAQNASDVSVQLSSVRSAINAVNASILPSVVAHYRCTTVLALTNVDTLLPYDVKVFDNKNVGSAGKFTAPVTGTYLVALKARTGYATASDPANNYGVTLFKNGASYEIVAITSAATTASTSKVVSGSTTVFLNAGDFVDARISITNSGEASLTGSGSDNFFSFVLVG